MPGERRRAKLHASTQISMAAPIKNRAGRIRDLRNTSLPPARAISAARFMEDCRPTTRRRPRKARRTIRLPLPSVVHVSMHVFLCVRAYVRACARAYPCVVRACEVGFRQDSPVNNERVRVRRRSTQGDLTSCEAAAKRLSCNAGACDDAVLLRQWVLPLVRLRHNADPLSNGPRRRRVVAGHHHRPRPCAPDLRHSAGSAILWRVLEGDEATEDETVLGSHNAPPAAPHSTERPDCPRSASERKL